MRAVDLIQKKRDGIPLSSMEITNFLTMYLDGKVPDYQMSAFMMAVYFNGMTDEELFAFTENMMNSGDTIPLGDSKHFMIDKHSTGGVGDKITIALAPLLACFDIGTAKLSGKGLGHTGGTIDKLESIPGFSFPETQADLMQLIEKTGIGIMGYSDSIVPLDKQLYSLRDVTATVPSIPLIASSIMSKKLAIGADGIILDIKVGHGAFMKTEEEAKTLAATMMRIGKHFKRNITAVLSGMEQPLGFSVGNSLEIVEAIETLKGFGPTDFKELLLLIAGNALMMKGIADNLPEAISMVSEKIATDEPLNNLKSFIQACGGNPNIVDDYKLLPIAQNTRSLHSVNSGYVHEILAEDIGKAAMILGAGRATKDDQIDHGVGVVLRKKVGDHVNENELLATFYFNDDKQLKEAEKLVLNAYRIQQNETGAPSTIKDIIYE
ncbi:thymidine phosphorylase [Algivirga pacifica]|uniref:thymidine phosphorylase n=1 Tax=Algivirga pacifica TaxID=1162670 RepID=A0ABP9CXB1_9BACT